MWWRRWHSEWGQGDGSARLLLGPGPSNGQAALPWKPVPAGGSSSEGAEVRLGQELWTFTPHPPHAHLSWALGPKAWKGCSVITLKQCPRLRVSGHFSRAGPLSGVPCFYLLQISERVLGAVSPVSPWLRAHLAV